MQVQSRFSSLFLVDSDTASQASQAVVRVLYNMPYHTCQISPFKSSADSSLLNSRQAQSPVVQHHGVDHKTSWLLAQQLDAVTVLVNKDENIAVTKVCRHLVIDDTAQHMETLAHVGRLGKQPVPHAVVQTEHG